MHEMAICTSCNSSFQIVSVLNPDHQRGPGSVRRKQQCGPLHTKVQRVCPIDSSIEVYPMTRYFANRFRSPGNLRQSSAPASPSAQTSYQVTLFPFPAPRPVRHRPVHIPIGSALGKGEESNNLPVCGPSLTPDQSNCRDLISRYWLTSSPVNWLGRISSTRTPREFISLIVLACCCRKTFAAPIRKASKSVWG